MTRYDEYDEDFLEPGPYREHPQKHRSNFVFYLAIASAAVVVIGLLGLD